MYIKEKKNYYTKTFCRVGLLLLEESELFLRNSNVTLESSQNKKQRSKQKINLTNEINQQHFFNSTRNHLIKQQIRMIHF